MIGICNLFVLTEHIELYRIWPLLTRSVMATGLKADADLPVEGISGLGGPSTIHRAVTQSMLPASQGRALTGPVSERAKL